MQRENELMAERDREILSLPTGEFTEVQVTLSRVVRGELGPQRVTIRSQYLPIDEVRLYMGMNGEAT